jgi:Fe-S cluster assembly protein SufD
MKNILDCYIKENQSAAERLNHHYPQITNALDKLAKQGFPNRGLEDWKFTNVSAMLEPHLKLSPPRNKSVLNQLSLDKPTPRLVFINGHLEESNLQSFSGVKFKRESLEDLSVAVPEGLAEDHFDWLNLSSLSELITIEIEQGFRAEKTIEILHIITDEMEGFRAHPRIVVKAENDARADILESTLFQGKSKIRYLLNSRTEFEVGKRAKIGHFKVQRDSMSSLHINGVNATVAQHGVFTSLVLTLGGKLVRNNVRVKLVSEGAQAIVNGVFVLNEDQHCDNFSIIDHAVSHTVSRQLFKGIADENAHGVFTGKIIVRPKAQHIDSRQSSKNLLFSKKARVNARPILEISADDVKCSHGVSVGQLNPEEIFYLETRGISREKAQRMLCRGFVQEVIDGVDNGHIQKTLSSHLEESLEDKNMGHFSDER